MLQPPHRFRGKVVLVVRLRDVVESDEGVAGGGPDDDPGILDRPQIADQLSAAGNRVEYVCFSRQIHGFITMGRVLDEARTAVRLCADTLRRALAA